MRGAPLLLAGACALACSGSGGSSAAPAPAPQTTSAEVQAQVEVGAGFLSEAQVNRGARTFERVCRECHVPGDFRGEDFEFQWRRQTAWNLFSRIVETMPEDNPGNLRDEVYADLVAYMLSLNGYALGGPDLAPAEAALSVIPLGPGARRTPPRIGEQP